jgi:ubiquinone/menaquinone biosynthesis C-methylase UbiE
VARERAYRDGTHRRQWEVPASPELADVLAALELPAGSEALDVGCGTGADAVFMARAGLSVIGVDISPTALGLARERAERAGVMVRWLAADVLELPLEDASLDLVTDRGCLHHIADADRPRYTAEIGRVLRPGGLLVIRDMCETGRHMHAVTPERARDQFHEPHFRVRHAAEFELVGRERALRAMLAIVERR